MGLIKKIKCKHCRRLFVPDHRNRNRQKYCQKVSCRKASKVASQKKWFRKSENRDYFKGTSNVQRVQEWRKQNPGYSKRLSKALALQDSLAQQLTEKIKNIGEIDANALQDFLMTQSPVIIGLISNFIGSALQDDIAETLLRMQKSGNDILYCHYNNQGESHDRKRTNFETSSP